MAIVDFTRLREMTPKNLFENKYGKVPVDHESAENLLNKPKSLFGSISADDVVKELDKQYKVEIDMPSLGVSYPSSSSFKPKSLLEQITENDRKRTKEIDEATAKLILTNIVPKGEKPTGPKSLLADAKIRKRIDVTVEQLRKFHENVKVLKASQQQILQTNIDELCLKYVLDWGSQLQEDHCKHLQEMMSLTTVPVLAETKASIGKLIEKMDELDVVGAMKDSWFKSKDKKISELKTELSSLQTEAATLRADYILNLHERAEIMKDELKDLRESLDPYIVTCSFFAEYEKDDFPKELYISRLSSLLATKASIGNDINTINAITNTFLVIIETINSIIRNELPMWISNLTAVLSGNAADLTMLQTTKTNIINKLTKTL